MDDDDSAALFYSLLRVIGGLLKRARAVEMRVVLLDWVAPEPEAEMKPLDIYSSAAAAPLLSSSALSLPPPPWGPDGLSADILRQGRHPLFSAALYLFEEAIVPSVGKGFWINC